ncbi:DnaJ domain-containing protein, putative [Eimeria necatrix]|uniref:DnaJ domain-containing protein, putative n=1 Tax=Eimeria necatrix TaxID=51315 RepID=U6MFK2_9EIME|nr:DnaJ domain-containing protein, putative [Eimeria necatrix]CDJ62806.1 DnaJ domain-containing protein, putative [Eimeria necatrix]
MREVLRHGQSEEESDTTYASADVARLHAVARRIQLREHASRQQQLQLHKQLQQQQQLLQQQQQQLHQQDALLRHQEQLLRQQEQQLSSRETEARLLLRQVSLLQQQLEERADRLAAAEGNYLDVTASLQQLKQRVALGDEAKLFVEEVRQQQQQDTQHLYAEVRRLRRQLAQCIRLSVSSDDKDRREQNLREEDADLDKESVQRCHLNESSLGQMATGEGQLQQPVAELSLPLKGSEGAILSPSTSVGIWCCAEAAEAASCTAWGCSAGCSCHSDSQHEAVVGELREALHTCRCAVDQRITDEATATSTAAVGAASLAMREVLQRCPASGADPEIVDMLLERLRAESMRIRVYSQQRHAASSSAAGSSTEGQLQLQGSLAAIDEPMEREAYDVLGTALPDVVLLPLLGVQNIATLLRLKQQAVLLANSRWLQLLRDTVGSKFLEGSSCVASSCSSNGILKEKGQMEMSPQAGANKESSTAPLVPAGETRGESRQHMLLQLLLRGSGGVAAAAGLLREGASPLAFHASTLTDRESGNNVFHLVCMRNLPQLFGTLSLTSLPCEFFYAHNREGKTPADLLPLLLPPYVEELRELQKTAAAELQHRAEFQDQVTLVACNLRAWRSVVFEYAAKASSLYRQHRNEAALALYTEALKLQQRLLEKQQQLDGITGGVSASNVSLLENTAKLAFNKACEWLLDFEGALNYIQLMRQNCPDSFSAEHYQKRRLYEAQLQASSFQVLGIEKGAPKATVNRAFRRMSILWHPDKASALSEDLRLRHENHFKRLNEARIALLDEKSYARQLLLPIQPLYRHPELLVIAKPAQQSTPSPLLVQPAQLTAEQQQDSQHHSEQDQTLRDPQQETDEVEPRLEKLQQQRQQLLRSIGSLQRQQHELQRELEEHQGTATREQGWASTSNSLRWHELQKLQQQQHNKQKRLIQCETEIDQCLHRKEMQHQAYAHKQHEKQQSDTRQQQKYEEREQRDPEAVDVEQVEGNIEERQTDNCSPCSDDWHHPLQQQPQQRNLERYDVEAPGVTPPGAPVGDSEEQPATQTAQTAHFASSSATTAAAAVNEAAATALSEGAQTNPEGDTPSWASVTSSDSDADDSNAGFAFSDYAQSADNSQCSSGFPTTSTTVPTPPPLPKESCASTQQCRSSPETSVAPDSPTKPTTMLNAKRNRESSCASFCRTVGRGCSRAFSAGPQKRTGEAATKTTVGTPAATARRSLTTCIYSTAPRCPAVATGTREANQPRKSTAYWEETNSSSKNSSSSSSSSSCSSSSSDASDSEEAVSDRGPDRAWIEGSVFGRNNFAAAATAAAVAKIAASAVPAASGGSAKAAMQKRQQQLPSPPPRRVTATQGARKDGSRCSSGGSSGCKTRGTSGRRRFVRTRGYLQQQQVSPHQQRQDQQEQCQDQQQQRQQLWRETAGGSETTGNTPSTTPTSQAAAAGPLSDATPQAATGAAWPLPPDFPEPFSVEGLPSHGQLAGQNTASWHQERNHRDAPQQFECSDSEILAHPLGNKQSDYGRERNVAESPVVLTQSLDCHGIRHQDSQQDSSHEHMLHRNLQPQNELQGVAERDGRQLLFPEEEQRSCSAGAEEPKAERLATPIPATPLAGRPFPVGHGDAAVPAEARWAGFEDEHASDKDPPQRNFRWPVPPQCRNTSDSGMGLINCSNQSSSATESVNPMEPTVAQVSRNGGGTSTSGAHHSNSASGVSSAGENCGSSTGNQSDGRIDKRESFSGRSDSDPEDRPGTLRESGRWRQSLYSQQQQHFRRQPKHLYNSATHEAPSQGSPAAAEAVILPQLGMTAPQRSSMPLPGCSTTSENSSATLNGGAVPAMATPTRLFPHCGPNEVEMQHRAHNAYLGCSQETSCSASRGAAAATSGDHIATVSDALRGFQPSEDGFSTLGGNGLPLRGDGRSVGDMPAPLSMWQHVRIRGSLPHTGENDLQRLPNRTDEM